MLIGVNIISFGKELNFNNLYYLIIDKYFYVFMKIF